MATSTRPGDLLASRYRLIDLLSESGGGRFWRAHDAVLERYVALHVIAESDPRAEGLIAAARSSATVLDPRILRVLDAETRDGLCFVVNEWGIGTSLDILVTHAGPLAPRPAAWLVAEVAAALARTHAAGVAHGRLNPENVLIDRQGAVHLIGLCVDAALHGLPPGGERQDRADLAGLLYCGLTGRWSGASASQVPPAHRAHGATLAPRQVLPGVPRTLDTIWREIDHAEGQHHRWRLSPMGAEHPDVSSAQAIWERLVEFVGDPTGLPDELASSILPINEIRLVTLPALSDPPVRLPDPEPGPEPKSEPEPEPEEPPIPSVTELPTEAGMPVFGDGDDVEWMRARATPPPPPPPFEEPPERPLFAPDPPGGSAARRARAEAASPSPAEIAARSTTSVAGERTPGPGDYWPWDDESRHRTAETAPVPGSETEMPGRNWLRLGIGVSLALVLLVALVVAFNMGRGRGPLGDDGEEVGPTRGSSPAPTVAPTTLTEISASDFDPLGDDGDENGDLAPLVVDGDPATTWRTQTYIDQLGPPPGLKTGVGLVLDLGETRTVTAVELQLVDSPADVEVTIAADAPTAPPEGSTLDGRVEDGALTLTASTESVTAGRTTGRYVLVWFTSLPQVAGGFRAEVSEVIVRGH